MKSRVLLALCCIGFAVSGCASALRRQADQLYARGSWAAAAELYDQALRDDPRDDQARLRRDRARVEAIRGALAQTHAAAAAHLDEPADTALEQAFRFVRTWKVSLPAEVAAQLQSELQAAEARLRRQLIAPIAQAPLLAQTRARALPHLLAQPELSSLRAQFERALADGAVAACTRMAERDDGPYLAELSARYCQLLGTPVEVPPVAPELVRSLRVDGAIANIGVADTNWLGGELNGVLERSVWHAPAGRVVGAALSGSSVAQFRRDPVVVDMPWTEQVAYRALETYSEPYTTTEMRPETVSYTEYESRTVSYTEYESRTVSYSASESYTYSCGTGSSYRTCTGSRPVTRTRTESHPVTRTRTESHPVTRTRQEMRPHTETRYRSATRWVTRYRPESRVYHLQAVRVAGSYLADLSLTIDLGDGAPLALRVRDKQHGDGLLHDVEFAPAGISPSRPNLATAQAWFAAHATELRDALTAALDTRWQERYCSAAAFSVEEAARCAHAGKQLPAAARAPLTGAFGEDATVLLAIERPRDDGAQP
jgi:hypothetical protein